jgi:hypothetical protein
MGINKEEQESIILSNSNNEYKAISNQISDVYKSINNQTSTILKKTPKLKQIKEIIQFNGCD